MLNAEKKNVLPETSGSSGRTGKMAMFLPYPTLAKAVHYMNEEFVKKMLQPL